MSNSDSANGYAAGAYDCSVDSVAEEQWNAIVASFADGVLDQTWSYGAACWGDDNLSTMVLRHEKSIVAACLVVLLRPPLLPGGIAHAKFGPLWRYKDASDFRHLRRMLECLREEYVENRGMFLRIMPQASTDWPDSMPEYLRALGFRQEDVSDPERFLVAVSHPEEQLRAGLKSKWRYHLKKAEREQLTIVKGTDRQMLVEFLDLYAAMRTRKTFADARALKQLSTISEALPPELKPSVWLCRHGEDAVAGAVVSRIGDTALYLFGATDERGRDLRAGYVLHWAIVTFLGRDDCRWYDLGGACEDAGLRQFKSGLVGKQGALPRLPGHFDSAAGAVSRLTATSLFRLKDYFGFARERLARTRSSREG